MICTLIEMTWKIHMKSKIKKIKNRSMRLYWLIERQSRLSLKNKALIYRMIKSIWSYGIVLWRYTRKLSNQSIWAPYYVTNEIIHIWVKSSKHNQKIENHHNPIIAIRLRLFTLRKHPRERSNSLHIANFTNRLILSEFIVVSSSGHNNSARWVLGCVVFVQSTALRIKDI